jgi:U3 small nucleolar RNA-associated protein 20
MAGTMKGKGFKSSKVVKPKKDTRRSTATTKHHRFQSFNERIAKLKIDPIRRRRNAEEREQLSEATTTYFGRSLEEWRDLNLSATFTQFAKEVAPYCDSLPIVLHNEHRIMDLLVAYIEKADALAMEPLLNLTSHFAHDLDTRFEKHFQRAVATITSVAAKHQDPAVVEWSFTCLAWLFKYLSRLLAPDLRPLYDLMAPYMGKEVQKPFIIRFAAESMSFLLRKAAAIYERDEEPLDRIMLHMLNDATRTEGERSAELHQQGVMTLLTEAIKGVQNGIHSGGVATVKSMLKTADDMTEQNARTTSNIVTGVLTSIIHHTNAETFEPIADAIPTHAMESTRVQLSIDLIFTIASVRKGTRIAHWKPLVAAVKSLIDRFGQGESSKPDAAPSTLGAVAVVFQTATIDAVLPALGIFETLRNDHWQAHFLRFCDLFARLGSDKFQQFVFPQFQKFVVEQWEGRAEEVCLLLPRWGARSAAIKVACPEKMQSYLLQHLQGISDGNGDDCAEAYALLAALPHLKLSDKTQKQVLTVLRGIVQKALSNLSGPNPSSSAFEDFALGSCLGRVLDDADLSDSMPEIWAGLCHSSNLYRTRGFYWTNILRLVKVCKSKGIEVDPQLKALRHALIDALSMPSHQIRQTALEIMQASYELRDQPIPEALATANAIESTPISMESSRAISMNIRRLIPSYTAAAPDTWARKAIPAYSFGLLHLHLAQAWDDAAKVVAEVCKTPDGEETVITLAQAWLQGATEINEEEESPRILDVESDGFQVVSDFECSNLMRMTAVSKQVFVEHSAGYPSAEQEFRRAHRAMPRLAPTSRSQALRVLDKIPQVAEKRSRMLVPVLLRWAGDAEATSDNEVNVPGSRWTRKDQKAMLAIFAQFTNPRVLYRSAEVYDALLNLCANGDAEIQREALKAIFAWKNPSILRYQEHLVNLLDEARFREEISVFLQDATEEEAVKPEDQAQLMPVLLRLIYGRAVAGGKHGQHSRRQAIFIALTRFGREVLDMFVDIAMHSVCKADGNLEILDLKSGPRAPLRQQLGMLNMLADLLDTLGPDLEFCTPKIMRAVLLCTVPASNKLDQATNGSEPEDASLLRSVRSAGLQCLVWIYGQMPKITSEEEAQTIMANLIQPRIEKFASENTQSVSVLLKLIAYWAAHPPTAAVLSDSQTPVLRHIALLLREPNAKDEVRLFVLRDIVDELLEDKIPDSVLEPYVSEFVQSIGFVLKKQPAKDVLDACINTISRLPGRITDEGEAKEVIHVCSELLTKPNRIVSPPSKTGLLRTLLPLLDRTAVAVDEVLYDAVSGLFSRLSILESRELLSEVLFKLCRDDPELAKVAAICSDLNARGGRLDGADHDRRERGFSSIYESWKDFNVRQWLPIVQNCLFFIRDADDMVNRASAVQGLERFIGAAQADQSNFRPLISQTLLPGIERGVQDSSELVRAEYLKLLGRVVEKMTDWQAVSDMSCLTASGDDEASVFLNVLHMQQHRRLRALRRLTDDAEQINSSNITKFWLPLLEHFVFDAAEGDAGRTLADQTVQTIGALAKSLNWSAFRPTFKRYVGYISKKEDLEKTVLRLLGALVDALASSSKPTAEVETQRSEIITRDFLPPLMEYLHHKDESTVDRRMPVAVTIVKLLLLLPEEEVGSRLTTILTDVCHVLRSRSQEARDQTRRTLATILGLLGPNYLGFILKELRSALQRGYQLHVLSFTVHSLLVNVIEVSQPGDLDHCLPDLVAVIMDDIFGITGQEKDAEEYKSGMKEIKSSKSFDTMELLARVTPVRQLGVLIRPIRALLSEKLDLKMIKKADELLIRLRKGVDQNPAADSRDMLIFCHEVVRQVYAEQNAPATNGVVQDYKVRKYLVQVESAKKSKSRAATTSQMYKLVSFALNLVRKVVRRHEDLQTPANMAGFLPMTGDALVQGQEEVKIAAIKLLATIIRLPMAELEPNAPVYVKEAVGIIKGAPSMTSDSAKAALELITAVLREKRSVNVKEQDIAHVLKALKTDIDEPDRQGIIYKFLRAVLGRKIVITEVYELMDEVAKIMVTNADRQVRESARSAYVQFVLDYPQGKDRWSKQAGFLVENLRYEYATGRQSVMEMLHQLLNKVSDEVFAQLAFTFFVALVPVHVSDTDQACQQMAGILISKLFERAEGEQLKSFLNLMEKWINNDEKPMIQVAALQCWSLYLKATEVPKKQRDGLRNKIAELLTSEDVVVGPQLLQAMLDTFAVLVEVALDIAFAAASAPIWDNLQQFLGTASSEIQEVTAKLIGAYFSHLASSSSKTEQGLAGLPLRGSGGLELDADNMRKLCRTSLRSLMTSSNEAPEALVSQIVRNLVFLGRCFAANKMLLMANGEEAHAEDEDEVQEADDAKAQKRGSTAIAYLLNRLSYILRQDTISTTARTAALQCQATLINHLSEEIPNLTSLLRPLYVLTTVPQPPGEAHANIVDKANELMELVQKRIGAEMYVSTLTEVRKQVKATRDERVQKRKLEAVAEPEKTAKEKKRKRELQKVKKKEKNSEARGKRRGW